MGMGKNLPYCMLAQLNATVGDIDGNTKKIIATIAQAKADGIELVVFPELAIEGYPPEDFLLLPHFIHDAEAALKRIIASTQGIAVVVGTIHRHQKRGEKSLHNSAAVIENGQLIGFQDKTLLPTYDVFDERRFFEPAREIHLWQLCGHSVGITICEDIWQHSNLLQEASYNRDPVKELAALHPDIVINLSASPFSTGKWEKRLKAAQRAAITLKCPFLLCNQVGGNDSLIFDGYSLYLNSQGCLVKRGKGFEEDLLAVDLNLPSKPLVLQDEEAHDTILNIYKALVLGIRNYFQKSGFSRGCIGLSGGIDSALVACLAVEALGKENVLGVLMPSRYSSEGSVTDALQLAAQLGIETQQIGIEEPFAIFLDVLEPSFAQCAPDVTEENIQARIRGMILMALSNKFGYIVLSTGNKSELAMGYSTLYGDMCGGLAVIGDILKQQVYQLANWINRNGEIIPWNTIHKPPSAELRPNQKDSDSLPDYAIIDNVLLAYIEENQSPHAIAERFGYPLELVKGLIKRIHMSEYKRRQSPLNLRISEKSFSAGRRFPIIQRYI